VAFVRLCKLLREIEADLDNLAAVKAFNLGLLKEVLRDEGHVQRYREDLKDLNRRLKNDRPTKAEALAIRARIERLERAIERYRDQLFIWKCLGDGLAYAYIDTFNIKHAFFETTSTDPKKEAGFVSGKVGLKHELATLLSAIKHNVPAVLSDITNIIRYGDVCLLGGNDPVPIEVKSRSGLNQRGKRQAARLAKLEAFLENDYAANFRGMPEVRRMEFSLPHRDCIEDINLCIQTARQCGYNVVCPERGLQYIAFFGYPHLDEVLSHIQMAKPIIFNLNTDKMEKTWAPYLPFVNSIRDPDDLYDFIVGKLSLMVVVDAAVLCKRLAMPGWRASILDHPSVAILLEEVATSGKIAISSQFLGRLGYEFMSLDWFVENERTSTIQMWNEMLAGQAAVFDVKAHDDAVRAFEAIPRLHVSDGQEVELTKAELRISRSHNAISKKANSLKSQETRTSE
jgi:hypothetical protein